MLSWVGVTMGPALLPVMFRVLSRRGLEGQGEAVRGGLQVAACRLVHPVSQGQCLGRCSTTFRAEVEMRAGIWMSLRRIVAVLALPRSVPVSVPMARDRLKVIVASTNQAAFALNTPDGK